MKKFPIVIALIFIATTAFAQNLVLHSGFESFITCPAFGQFSSTYITSWDKPSIGSTDYYHYNCPGIQPTVQSPHTGEAYSGIIAYNFGTEYREYLTGMFSSPLVAGTWYEVGFYVSLNDGYIQAVEELGAYISVAAPGFFSNSLHINVIPQIENSSGPLDDTASWKYVNGQYLASGGEMFITIGNFHDDAGTTITQPGTSGSFGAYYFIDDVMVTEIGASSVQQFHTEEQPTVNYSEGNLVIHYPASGNWARDVRGALFDISGKHTMELPVAATHLTAGGIRKGIYLVMLENNSGEKCLRKLLVY